MNIVIDSGNTFSKIAWFEQDKLLKWEQGLLFDQLLERIHFTSDTLEHILFSSVNIPFTAFVEKLQSSIPIIPLTNETPLPIGNQYGTVSTLGVDRLAAAVGAMEVTKGGNVVVIDMGTCVTCDYVNNEGSFQGGMILPGLNMRFKAMHTFTARLPLVEVPESIPALVGDSTITCMQSGVINGMIAEINGLIHNFRQNYPNCNVVVCGGDMSYFENHIKQPIFAIPELVLIGLNRILQYNVAKK